LGLNLTLTMIPPESLVTIPSFPTANHEGIVT
jgi:hypothetical protein